MMTPEDKTTNATTDAPPTDAPVDAAAAQQAVIDSAAARDAETPAENATEPVEEPTAPPVDAALVDAPPAPDPTPVEPVVETPPAPEPTPAPIPATPPVQPSADLSERDKVLRSIQKAHEEWVGENLTKEPKSTQQGKDASQFAMDTDLPQDALLDKIKQNTADSNADPLESAIERLQNLVKTEGLDSSVEIRRKGQ